MRVLTMIGAGEFGGAEQHVFDLLRSVKRVEPRLAVFYEGELASRMRAVGVPVRVLSRSPWRAIAEVVDYARAQNIVLLHTHGVRANVIGRLAARRAGLPVVTTVHSVLATDYPDPLKRWLFVGLEHLTRRQTDRFICVSRALRDDLAAGGIPPERLTVIHNGIDTSRFHPDGDAVSLNLPRPLIGTVARMHAAKGYDVLLDAARELVKGGFAGSFVWIGDGPLKTQLSRRIQEVGLEDRVRIVGYRSDVERWMRAVDIVVLPSLSEGFGLALLEALACGKPVVASRVGGFAEVGEGLAGVRLVPPGDPYTLAAAVDGMARERLETPDPDAVARLYSLERMVAKTEDVYAEILATMAP